MNFIHEGYIDNLDLCDEIIQYHKNSITFDGTTFGGVDKSIKDSKDCDLKGSLFAEYVLVELQNILNDYVKKFPMCNTYNPFAVVEPVVVQHYLPNGGFKEWHTERTGHSESSNKRHLVFLTYLNDVPDGGTEFYNQGIITTAKKGKTLIWPVDWTYTHRGQISTTQEKYVVTGWYSFIERKND